MLDLIECEMCRKRSVRAVTRSSRLCFVTISTPTATRPYLYGFTTPFPFIFPAYASLPHGTRLLMRPINKLVLQPHDKLNPVCLLPLASLAWLRRALKCTDFRQLGFTVSVKTEMSEHECSIAEQWVVAQELPCGNWYAQGDQQSPVTIKREGSEITLVSFRT